MPTRNLDDATCWTFVDQGWMDPWGGWEGILTIGEDGFYYPALPFPFLFRGWVVRETEGVGLGIGFRGCGGLGG
jgi:hypothetical protein